MMYNNNDGHDDGRRDGRDPYYYSYGPYHSRSGSGDGGDEAERVEVEMISPRPVVAPYSGGGSSRRKSSFSSKFYMFILGALVVGGLMFAADSMNLFSSDEQALIPVDELALTEAASVSGTSTASTSTANMPGGNVLRPANISDIVNRTSNAVVKIETTVKRNSVFNNPFFNDPFFDGFFDDNFGGGEQEGGMGSGFIFDPKGYILTNEHVIEGADKIFVKLEGSDKKYPAKLLGTAYDLDLAVLKIEGKNNFPFLRMGSSDAARVGDWVIAIGNPYGFEHTVTVGVVSAKERPISIPDRKGTREYKNLLQTDASINPGNSGGPLLNLRGEVIGINTAVSAQAQGIGFAIPMTTVNGVLESLKANKKIVKPYMGVRLADIKREWMSELGLRSAEGSLIMQVEKGAPAERAGLQPYDVVVAINGKKVKNTKALQDAIQAQKPGARVNLQILRDGRNWSASVILGKMETGLSGGR